VPVVPSCRRKADDKSACIEKIKEESLANPDFQKVHVSFCIMKTKTTFLSKCLLSKKFPLYF